MNRCHALFVGNSHGQSASATWVDTIGLPGSPKISRWSTSWNCIATTTSDKSSQNNTRPLTGTGPICIIDLVSACIVPVVPWMAQLVRQDPYTDNCQGKLLTCLIGIISCNVCKVQRQHQFRKLLRGNYLIMEEITRTHLTSGGEVENGSPYVLECDGHEVAARIELQWSKGWKGKVCRCSWESIRHSLGPFSCCVHNRCPVIKRKGWYSRKTKS